MKTKHDNAAVKLAWEVEISDMRCVVFAATAPKARWIAVRSFWEAGYGRQGMWPFCKAQRIPRLDNSPLKDQPPRAFAPEYAEDMK